MIRENFGAVCGHPCWGIRWDSQTNLALNFGNPRLKIRDMRASSLLGGPRRLVVVKGQWQLWITHAYWRLELRNGLTVTGSTSRRKILKALARLNGEKLRSVAVRPDTGATSFSFDLGSTLAVRRFEKDSVDDLWILFKPSGYVLAVNGRGEITHHRGSVPQDEVKWRALRKIAPDHLRAQCRLSGNQGAA